MTEHSQLAISVVVATRNRADHLVTLLSSLATQTIDQCSFEVVIVDNSDGDETGMILKCDATFRLIPLYEEKPGKSRALNRALEQTRGKLIVFTDDDVTTCPQWLASLHSAAVRFSSADVFCGPIIPDFPANTPEWLQRHSFADALFGRFEPKLTEGLLLPSTLVPFGANFAVRSSALAGKRFRLDLGPSQENGPLFCEDTEFVQRFRQESRDFVFVPSARVFHHVGPHQIEIPALFERSFHLGRGSALHWKRPRYLHARYRFRTKRVDEDDTRRFDRGGFINYYSGQLCELHRLGSLSFDEELQSILEKLEFRSHPDLLSESAMQFYGRPEQTSSQTLERPQ